MSVGLTGEVLTIEVTKDGQPRTGPAAVPGHGLQGMAERAAALGGRCDLNQVVEAPLRVLVADNHALVRAGFRSILADEADMEVIEEATRLITISPRLTRTR